jgi:hypothetical protein
VAIPGRVLPPSITLSHPPVTSCFDASWEAGIASTILSIQQLVEIALREEPAIA